MKYKYVYEVRTNNLCSGNLLLEVCDSLAKAFDRKFFYEQIKGCCDIYKKRVYIEE
jgi:hypothetical protein